MKWPLSLSRRAISSSQRSFDISEKGRERPPRNAKSGSASNAAPAEPYRRNNCRNVVGPTRSVRQRRNQSQRSEGLSGRRCIVFFQIYF
jgi:hypothetical protein